MFGTAFARDKRSKSAQLAELVNFLLILLTLNRRLFVASHHRKTQLSYFTCNWPQQAGNEHGFLALNCMISFQVS